MKYGLIFSLLFTFILIACKPTHGVTASTDGNQDPKAPAAKASQIDCKTWGPDSLMTIQKLSLYKEYHKQNRFEDAINDWRYVFANAPGVLQYPLIDGVQMYKYFIDKETDAKKQKSLTDTLFMIWDARVTCFGENADVLSRMSLDYLKYRPDDVKPTIAVMEKAFKIGGNETPSFILGPYMSLYAKEFLNKEVSNAMVLEKYSQVTDVIDYNIRKGDKNNQYGGQQAYVDELLSKVPGLFECETLKPILQTQYKNKPDDTQVMAKVFNQMRAARCTDDPFFIEVTEKYNEVEPTAPKSVFLARHYAANNNTAKAIKNYNRAIDLETSSAEKAEHYLNLAKMYQDAGDFPQARTMAQRALSQRSNWGEPYILIGDLYASSGSKCGPGTGFESQVVTWVAVDQYEKAKAVDPGIASKANSRISRYTDFYPEKSECFFRSISEGSKYTVGCWINETTTVRCK